MSTNTHKNEPHISNRKADHIDLCIDGDVSFKRKTTLFEDIQMIHNALPELQVSDVDLRCHFAGHTFEAPLIIAAMTGGVDRANEINKDLASVAEELGIGFAFGSQRPLLSQGITDGYLVRDVAPNAFVFGNLGVVQARDASLQSIEEMLRKSSCNALCIHLNPAMEVVQPEGDQDFRGGYATIEKLVQNLSVPVVVKETGCGISRGIGKRLVDIGVQWVDVSGSGGTSWVAVETHRAQDRQRTLGDCFWDWGIPTAASVMQLQNLGLGICATGGVNNGLEIAKAISIGATCGGIARKFLQAHARGGRDEVLETAKRVIEEIRIATLLCGLSRAADLQQSKPIIGGQLKLWSNA